MQGTLTLRGTPSADRVQATLIGITCSLLHYITKGRCLQIRQLAAATRFTYR